MSGERKNIQEMIFEYFRKRILNIARRAKSAKHICSELRVLRSTLAGLGGKQMPPERKRELYEMILEAAKIAGCKDLVEEMEKRRRCA